MKKLATHFWRFWQLWHSDPSLKVLVVTIMIQWPIFEGFGGDKYDYGWPTFLPSRCPVVAVGQKGRRKHRRVLLSFCGFCIIWISTIVVLLLCLFVYLFDLDQAHHHCFCLFIFLIFFILTRLTIVVLLLSKPSTVELMVVHILGGCKAVPWKSKSLPNKTLQK